MREDYLRAKRLGDREYSRAVAHGEYPYLPALDYILRDEGVLSEEDAGIMEIPLSLIAGTRNKGRQNAFSRSFMPLFDVNSEFAAKWQQLYEFQLEEGIREPVEVYEFLKCFYVQEGNKRVSVSRYLGAQTIAARVKRILPRRKGDEEIELYYDFLEFFKVAPIYEISFSRQGSFRRLAEVMGRDMDAKWPMEDVRELKNSYQYFEELFLSKGGGDLKLTAGDAFLIYLGFYGKEGVLEEGFEIGRRLDRIWKEILTSAHEHNIELLEKPELISEEKAGLKFKGLFGQFFKSTAYNKDRPLNIAFLYEDFPENSGWVYSHELGRQLLQENLGELIKTSALFGCDTDDAVRMGIDAAVSSEGGGAEIVFTTAPSLMPETLKGAIHYPNVHFLNCSLNLSHNAVRTYDTKLYGAKFLLGALSAVFSENHRICYLATSPVFGEIADINAFAIGAGMVDPRAVIRLYWSCRKDFDWHKSIEESGAMIFSGPESHRSGENSREFGIYCLNEKYEEVGLAASIRNWGRYYTEIIKTMLNGSFDSLPGQKNDRAYNYWWGLSAGVVDIVLSDRLPYSAKKLVEQLREGLIRNAVNPFEGELRSQNGVIQGRDAGRLNSQDIIAMDWLNDNVEGSIPDIAEMKEIDRKTVEVSGVMKEYSTGSIVPGKKRIGNEDTGPV